LALSGARRESVVGEGAGGEDGRMTKEERAEIIRWCYDEIILAADDILLAADEMLRADVKAWSECDERGIGWKTHDAIITELQVARERAVRKTLK
jgi:hypothetical protein